MSPDQYFYQNGKRVPWFECSLFDYINQFDLAEDRLVLELNGEILAKSDWNKIRIKPKDVLEIIHFVGGG